MSLKLLSLIFPFSFIWSTFNVLCIPPFTIWIIEETLSYCNLCSALVFFNFPSFILWDYISLQGGHFNNRHCIPKSLLFTFSSWLFSSLFFASPHVHKHHWCCWNQILLLASRLPCNIEPIFLFYAISLLPYFGIQVSYEEFLRFAVLTNGQ